MAKEKKVVEVIEPNYQVTETKKKLNVAAYARVSTSKIEQKDSFDNQKKYYEEKIKSNPTYNFVGVFADEAISGTTDKRPNFQRMIRLAEQGHIDIILTKSISRFSRNVADLLSYCERLKNCNVNLIFEENGIELLNSTGTLMLTILGAVAQMEVENTSDHINWTLKQKMKNGEFVGQPNPLGYDVVEEFVDGRLEKRLVINEEEAEIVRYIFSRYLEGAGGTTIANELEKMGALTKRGAKVWHSSTVMGIIKNEKYTGKLVQGKTFTVNPIGHLRKDNKGEASKYVVEDDHEAIISLEDWKKAQDIIEGRCVSYADGRRKGTTQNTNRSVFTSKLVCGYCGKNYVRRMTHAGSKYAKFVWNCSTASKGHKSDCPKCKVIDEEFIKQSAVGMIKNLLESDDSIFYLSNEQINKLMKKSEKEQDKLEEQILRYHRLIEQKQKQKNKILSLLLAEKISDDEFELQRKEIDADINEMQTLLNDLEREIDFKNIKRNTNRQIIDLINEGKAEGFNKELFDLLVEKVIIGGKRSDGADDPRCLHFELKDYNLNTDMVVKVNEEGVPRYTMNEDMIANSENHGKKKR